MSKRLTKHVTARIAGGVLIMALAGAAILGGPRLKDDRKPCPGNSCKTPTATRTAPTLPTVTLTPTFTAIPPTQVTPTKTATPDVPTPSLTNSPTPYAPPTPSVTTKYPIRVALLVPADYPITEPDVWRLTLLIDQTMQETQAWFVQQIAHTFAYDFRVHRSLLTMRELQQDPGVEYRDETCFSSFGTRQGTSQNAAFYDIKAALGWPTKEDASLLDRNSRWLVIFLNGGGFAGGGSQWGSVTIDNGTVGFAALGDWGINAYLTGAADPCCEYRYGPYWCTYDGFSRSPTLDLMHEFLHGMWVDSHNPYIRGFDPMSDEQKANLIAYNQPWLIPVP